MVGIIIGGGSEQARASVGDCASLPYRCPVCGEPLNSDGYCSNCEEYPEEEE